MALEQLGHEKRRRVAAEIGRHIADFELPGARVIFTPVRDRGCRETCGERTRDLQMFARAKSHAEKREGMHGLARGGQQGTKLAFIGLDPIPIADEPPFVMEPYANSNKLRIEFDGGAVGLDRLLETAKTFERRAHIGMRLGEIRAQGNRLAIGFKRLLESFLALQDIAEIDVGLRRNSDAARARAGRLGWLRRAGLAPSKYCRG